MLILAIDDEPKMLRLMHKAIEEAAPEAQIMDFPWDPLHLPTFRGRSSIPR